MIEEVSKAVRARLSRFDEQDNLLFHGREVSLNDTKFCSFPRLVGKRVAFVDGGQAEIVHGGSFMVHFIRVFAQVFQGEERSDSLRDEFFVFSWAQKSEEGLVYKSQVFGSTLIRAEDLFLAVGEDGLDQVSLSEVGNLARRLAERALAMQLTADIVVMDGDLDARYAVEARYPLGEHVCSVAKTCSLFTAQGNSPTLFLDKLSPHDTWLYHVGDQTSFVKWHAKARHVFRFDGDIGFVGYLMPYCSDPLFLGYPYGLLFVDQLARVSNREAQAMRAKLLLNAENEDIAAYLSTQDAHSILDTLS